ncbi:MAG: amidohydrolase [Bacteroidales bacterium]|nr:amidohydrolase [Bacteroidales bacterium]
MENIEAVIKQMAHAQRDRVIEWRRWMHRHPDLSQEEYGTMEFVAERLREMGLEPKTGIGKTGVMAMLRGNEPDSYCVALRSDYDALPITECTGLPFASEKPGVMHACGHDMHTCSLLGAIKILTQLRDHISGSLMFIFEPSEEKYPGGARMMMEDGLFDEVTPNEIYSFHCLPEMDCGKVGMRKGKYMASTDELYWTVKGLGGHGATPHLSVDPIVVASHIVIALQQVVSRNAAPMMPTVLTIGKIQEVGGRTNIIPDMVKMEGIIRTFDEKWRLEAHEKIRKISTGVAEAMGAECDLFIDYGYPYVFNDDACTQQVHDNACAYIGEENVEWLDLRMTAEDFAFFAQKIPACYFRIGIHEPGTPFSNLHRPNLIVDERSLELANGFVAYNAMMALHNRIKQK